MTPVALDLRALQTGFKSHAGRGIGRYVRSLLEGFAALGVSGMRTLVDGDGSLDVEVATLARRLGPIDEIPASSWADRTGPARVHLRQHVVWPRALAAERGLVHFCSQTDAPAFGRLPSVVSVLDLIPHRLESLYRAGKSRTRYRLARALERRALRQARGLLAISEYTRDDLVSLLGVDRDRVVVTHPGVVPGLGAADPRVVEAFRARAGLPESWLLYVGGLDARKNVAFLFEVLRELRRERPGLELVLAGRHDDDPDRPALVARAQALGLENAVRWLGFVAETDLSVLYSAASVFVFPSLYEGFGFPPLEAMACSTPVVAADRTCLPEVLGDAALLASPEDVGAFAGAIAALLDDPERRRTLAAAGPRRAARFTWERTARETLAAYERFAAE